MLTLKGVVCDPNKAIPFDPKLVSEFMKNTKQVKLVSKALEEELKKRGIN